MERGLLKQKVLDLYKQNDERVLTLFILKILTEIRAPAVTELGELMERVDGKLRLKVMEALIQDGGEDLIPLFIERIANEKNKLFAKSQILLMGEFEHAAALEGLAGIGSKLAADLKPTFNRALAKLNAKFREHFYMNEFRSGNIKRVRAAADQMLKQPHPSYTPFLNKLILNQNALQRSEGLRVLEGIGDKSSLESVFNMLDIVRNQLINVKSLEKVIASFETGKDKNPESLLKGFYNAPLMQQEGVPSHEDMRGTFRKGVTPQSLGLLLDPFAISSDFLIKDCLAYLQKRFLGETPGDLEISRLKRTFDDYKEQLERLENQIFAAAGNIGLRIGATRLLDRVRKLGPEDKARSTQLMIAFLSGFKSADALQMLVQYLDQSDDNTILGDTLTALDRYELGEVNVPKGLKDLAFSMDNGPLRRRAVNMLPRFHGGLDVISLLLDHEALVFRSEAIQVIADRKLEVFFERLCNLTKEQVPNSLLVVTLEALAVFPNEETGDIAVSFIHPDQVYDVRNSALATLFQAGGSRKFFLITDAIKKYPSKGMAELIDSFLTLLEKAELGEIEPDFLAYPDFWLEVFNLENLKFRLRVLSIIENFSWSDPSPCQPWINCINKALSDYPHGKRDTHEERRMRVLVHTITRKMEEAPIKTKAGVDLENLLTNYEGGDHLNKVQTIRRLNLIYKPSWVAGEPHLLEHLLDVVENFLTENEGNHELVSLAISLAGKIDHPRLKKTVDAFADLEKGTIPSAPKGPQKVQVETKREKLNIRSVFVMDDSRYITTQLVKILEKSGYRASTENDPKIGLEHLEDEPFDLLVLDLHMPEMKGWDFLAELRKNETAPPATLVITASRNKEDIRRINEMGVDAILLKPFPMGDFLGKIRELETIGRHVSP